MTAGNTIINRYQTFHYDADDRLVRVESYAEEDGSFVNRSVQTLEYEGAAISRRNILNAEGEVAQYRTYEYDNRGNVKRELYYSSASSSEFVLANEFTYEYDDKNNPFSVLRALGNPGLWTNPNNIVGRKTISYRIVPGTETSTESTTKYLYNPLNYPVKVISDDSEFAYRY